MEQVFLLPEPTALAFSLRATRLAPAHAALFIPRAECTASFSAFAFAQMMFGDPFLLIAASQCCGCGGSYRSRDLCFLLLFGLRGERKVGDVTKATQNSENYRICTQAKYTASASRRY